MSDIFRIAPFTPLSEEKAAAVYTTKKLAQELLAHLDTCENSREKSLAITKLEECVMWAVKGITA